jgi:hypothetical protein
MKPSKLAAIAATAGMALSFAACAGGGGVAKYDPKIPAEQQAPTYVVAVQPGGMKNIKKVFIGSFNVVFVTKSGASAQAGGGVGQGTVNLHSYYHLKGVDDQRMQAITNKLYADAKAKLEAAGYEVVDVSGDPVFAQMIDSAQPSPFDQNGARVFAPKGLGVWASPGGAVQTMGRKGVLAQSSGDYPAQYEAQLMSEKGLDAVHFTCQIDYAKLDTHGGYGAGEARVSASMALSVNRGAMQFLSHDRVKKQGKPWGKSGYLFVADPKPTTIHIKQPIVADGNFGTIKDTTNSGVALIQGILGGRKDKTYDVEADGPAYEALAVSHAQALMDMILATAKL